MEKKKKKKNDETDHIVPWESEDLGSSLSSALNSYASLDESFDITRAKSVYL